MGFKPAHGKTYRVGRVGKIPVERIDDLMGRAESVTPLQQRHCPGMTVDTGYRHLERTAALNAGDGPNGQPRTFQPGPLLDMRLDVTGKGNTALALLSIGCRSKRAFQLVTQHGAVWRSAIEELLNAVFA